MPNAATNLEGSATLSEGLGVLHLFWRTTPLVEREAIVTAIEKAEADGDQVVTVAMLGHKADLATMVLGPGHVATGGGSRPTWLPPVSNWSTATCRSPRSANTPQVFPTR
ncbi:MAG: hypothetical protein R2710_23945 [Acidimicrobiales bacterium]